MSSAFATARSGSTVELSNLTLTLRRDLQFTLQRHGDELCYLLEDEKNSKFYRIGIPEYKFLSLLDGTTSIRDALAHTAGLLGDQAFTEADAAAICKWLIDCNLAYTDASQGADRLWEQASQASTARTWQRINPLVFRLPVMHPDRWIRGMTRKLQWWFSGPAFLLWASTLLLAGFQLITHWEHLPFQSQRILAPDNLIWLILIWCVLKLAHELSHAVACQRFGGHVREAGLLLILFAPIPYVDVTSSWRFRSKWSRIVVSFAGMYTELFLAALAALVWVRSEPGIWSQQAYNVMITASVMTVLFNANPLMRFDGYYILSDLTEIPNLSGLGQQYLNYLARRYLLGVKLKPPRLVGAKGLFIRCYGFAALLWRVMVTLSIFLAASCLWEGVGLALAMVAGACWIVIPATKFLRYLSGRDTLDRPQLPRFALVTAVALMLATCVILLPEPGGVRVPGVVRYAPRQIVRAPHDGFLRKLYVQPGQPVQAGEPVGWIENQDLPVEVRQLQLAEQQSLARARAYQTEGDIAGTQVEAKVSETHRRRAREQAERLQKSHLRADQHGLIVTRDLLSRLGTYFREGEEVLQLGDETCKEIYISIPQQDVELFSRFPNREVQVFVRHPKIRKLQCRLQSVDPRATATLPEPALSAKHGGPIPVRPPETNPEDKSPPEWELVEPRFEGLVQLDPQASQQLRAGQVVWIRLDAARGTLGQFVYRSVEQWIKARLEHARDH